MRGSAISRQLAWPGTKGPGAGIAIGSVVLHSHVLTLQPDGNAGVDTYVEGDHGSYNNGIATPLVVGGYAVTGQYARGLIQFDLSSIPSTAIIVSAILTLYCESEANTTDQNVGIHRSLVQWYPGVSNAAAPGAGVNASSYNYRNANGSVAWAGGTGGGSGSDYAYMTTDTKLIDAPTKAFDFDVLLDVSNWASGVATNYGWWLISPEEATANSRKRFTSSNGGTSENRPKLVVVYKTNIP